jgi:DNA-directed RNA polymerase subunit RPC12/RpoP
MLPDAPAEAEASEAVAAALGALRLTDAPAPSAEAVFAGASPALEALRELIAWPLRHASLAAALGDAPPAALPAQPAGARVLRFMPRQEAAPAVACPRCGSQETVETSHFGSTACKALYRCLSCREPFDYFKPY